LRTGNKGNDYTSIKSEDHDYSFDELYSDNINCCFNYVVCMYWAKLKGLALTNEMSKFRQNREI